MYTMNYKPFYMTVNDALRDAFEWAQKMVYRLLVVGLIAVLAGGNVYFYHQSTQKDVKIAQLELRLSQAIIPEATWSEFGHNRFVVPAGKAYDRLKESLKGLFSSTEE